MLRECGAQASSTHLPMGVVPLAQGTNATGTPSAAMSSVARSGHTEPPARGSALTRSTWPAAPSTGSRSSFQRSSLPKSAARNTGCVYQFVDVPRPLALLWPATT